MSTDTVTVPTPINVYSLSPQCEALVDGEPCCNKATWGARSNCCDRTTATVCGQCRADMYRLQPCICDICKRRFASVDDVFTWWRI